MLKSYPKILPAVGKYGDLVLGGDTVECTEKVDGSLFAFGKDANGQLHMRSKGTEIFFGEPTTVQKLFKPAVDHVLSIQDRIPNNHAFYGETLSTERHNTLEYGRVPKNHIALFGVTDFDRTTGSDYATVSMWAENFDIEPVALIGELQLGALTDLRDMLDRESSLGKCKIEGVVVKNYARPMEFGGMVLPFAAIKYVSEQFKEKHSNNPDWKPQRDRLQEIFDAYRTEARWEKGIQHLRDAGKLLGEPKDIGALMKEVSLDLIQEESESLKTELLEHFRKTWLSTALRGLPDYYKNKLLEA